MLLSDAPFYAPLRNSLNLTNGSGSPTFTRATAATVFDNEGKLVTVASGVPRFSGARRVENLIDNTVLPTVTTGTGTVSLSNGVFTLDNSASGSFTLYRYSGSNVAGTQYRATLQYRRISGSNGLTIDISDIGTTVNNPPDGNWYTYTTGVVTVTHATSRWFDMQPGAGTIFEVKLIQLENVTGQADQTMSEFVAGTQWFVTNKNGTEIPDMNLLGLQMNSGARTNNLLHCRDLTQAAWVKTNITPALSQTGIDGKASACSLITATAVNATVLQTITAAATAASSSFYVKRSVGSGSIFITRDGGTTWVDITSLINSSTFTRVKIENTSVTNPVVGFKIATNGDAVIVDYGQNEAGQQVSMPILTTTAAATRNADVLNYPTAGNFSDTAGTILATVRRDDWSASNGSVVGSSTTGLHTRGSTNGAQALDGTNTVLGPTGAVEGKRTMGIRYSGSSMKVYSGGSSGSPGNYDGSFNLSNIGIITGTHGYIRDVAIWQTELSDADLDSVATPRTTPGVTAESITAADTLGSAVKVSTSRAESSAVAEAMATAISTGASVAESSAVAEASSPEVSVSAGRSESLTVAEAASPEVSVSIGRSESLIVVDNPSVSVQPLNVESTNTGVIADNISQALGAIMQHQISATYSITTITASYSIISFEAKI